VDLNQRVNPYIAGSPVTGTEMFYGRQDVFSFIQRNLIGRHRDTPVVLYGQRRTGKTSVLYQLHRHLDASYRCVFVDLHGLNLQGTGNLLLGLANSVSRTLRRDFQIRVEIPDRATFLADPESAFETMFLDKVWPALGQDHLVLMLDEVVRLDEEVKAGRLEREVFDYLRHLMQHYPRLNFIFSLGSGLEEMAKDYAFLFSVTLYHRISFLESAAASGLITQPVLDHYKVAPEAIEKILKITSGHPYYTQLVCHCVFDLWSRSPKEMMSAADIDNVLTEAIELGSANLTYVWEDSTPGEQALMAGLAVGIRSVAGPATVNDARAAWHDIGVSLPEGEVARALRSLISREVLAGSQAYLFNVDLQRLWLERHRRIDWVKDELAESIAQWNRSAGPWPADAIPVKGERLGSAPTQVNASSVHHAVRREDAEPKRRTIRRRRYLVAVVTAVLLAAYLTATSATHVFPFPNAASSFTPALNLATLLPGDLGQNLGECHETSASKLWTSPGLEKALHCTDAGLKGGNVYAYQLDSAADFEATWQNFNHWWKFTAARAGNNCPPRGTTEGEVNFNNNSDLPAGGHSVLECGFLVLGSNNTVPTYAYYFPTNNVIVIASGASGASFSMLNYWVTHSTVQKQSS
jgi:hypothetical protein